MPFLQVPVVLPDLRPKSRPKFHIMRFTDFKPRFSTEGTSSGEELDTAQWENHNDNSTKFIEFVTSPNNPDGHLREPKLTGPNTQVIHDRVYYWPHFTAIPAPADDDVMIFDFDPLVKPPAMPAVDLGGHL
ncbi:hypothetical protein H6P81_001360 [Aristolochia fimbriata]|uniref:Alliinase C-terminal domain-containing protein n=1 Tax=Aristolochia fimbriata TaxID=158543 RepID=A0AAV7F9Y2_ARIFI|nr:hypothetical protein H6P81_001360 [Aristolochia fimbriata]